MIASRWSRLLSIAMAFATPLISGGSASAALVFYESFEGFSAGGWHQGSTYGEWTVNVPGVGVAAKGLSYSNGDVWVHGGANALQFASGANDNAGAALVTNFGSQTGTLYFSFFAEANPVVHGGQGPWLQPMLSPNETGGSDHASVIVNAGPATYFGGLGGETAVRIRGTAATTELLDHYVAGSTVFVVGKLWKSNPGGNYDRLSAALNPTTLTEPASWTATVSHDLGAGSVEHLRFRTDQISGGELAWIDEIRVGTSYEDAIGIADGVWTGTQHGNWSDRTNWQNGLPARGSHRTATFNIDLPEGERFVSVDNGRVIGNLVFGDTDPSSAGSWALLSGTLTLETTSPEVPTITVHPLGPGAAVRITAILAGHQGLIKAGEGRLILTPRENDYGPTTDVQGGTLQIGNNEHSVFVGTADHQYTIAAGADLVFSRNRYAADFTSQSIGGAGDVIFRGQKSGIFRFGGGYSGTLTYAGKTVVDLDVGETWDTGTLWLEKDDVLPHATVVEMQSGKIYLRNQTGSGLTMAGLEGGAETFLVPRHGAGMQQLTLDVAEGSTYVYAGTIGSDGAMGADGMPRGGDNLALTKTGLGTQVLAGNSNYAGGTLVSGGMLQVTGSLAAGEAIGVHHGGTLAGTGTIHSTVSILAGGALAPGSGADGLHLGSDLAFEPGAFFDVEIDSLGGASRVRMAGGTLSPGNATIRVTLRDDFDPEPHSSWTILSGEGEREGGFMPKVLVDGPKFLAAGKWLEVSYLNSVVLTVAVAVPEPAALVMAAVGLAMLLLRRRR